MYILYKYILMKSSLHICYHQNIWVQKSGPIACVIYNVFLGCGTRVFPAAAYMYIIFAAFMYLLTVAYHVLVGCGIYMYIYLLARELVFPCLVNCSRSTPLEGYMCLWFVLCCLCSLRPMGHDKHMGQSADSSSGCVCVCVCVCVQPQDVC